MKKILVILSLTLIFAITMALLGIAYAGGIRGVGLIGVSFFFTGGIIVILVQLIPAGILFSSLIGSAFSSLGKGEMPIRATYDWRELPHLLASVGGAGGFYRGER